ncbi:MAG: hypothetical protein AAF515_03460 [Pseudomonadota bacterium]
MSDTYTLWHSNGGCTACDQLESGNPHQQVPARPHPHCRCAIVTMTPAEMEGVCIFDEPLIWSVGSGDPSVDGYYDEDRQAYVYTRITWHATYQVLCRDGTVATVEIAFEDEDPLVADTSTAAGLDDVLDYLDRQVELLESQALDKADCPDCEMDVSW